MGAPNRTPPIRYPHRVLDVPLTFSCVGFFPLIFVGFIALMIVVIVLGARQAKQRREALAGWAAARGMTFQPDKDRRFEMQHPEFQALQRGSDRYAFNITRGRFDGRDLIAFDYHYETTSRDKDGKTQTHNHYFSAVILEAELPLKELYIRPEGLFDGVKSFFGYNDLDFESAEFSRRYHVTAPDRQWAYDVLHARVIEYLLRQPPHAIVFGHRRVLVMRPGRRLDVPGFMIAVEIGDTLLDSLPDYVRERQKPGADHP